MTVGSPTAIALGSMFEVVRVVKSTSHESDHFTATCHNNGGRRSGLFVIGQQVDIYHDVVIPGSLNQIFSGRIDYVNHIGQGPRETIMVGGRDYTSYLMDERIQQVYLSGTSNICEIGSIVRDLIHISSFSGTVGTDLVSGVGIVLQAFTVKNKTIYEAITELAHIAGYDFYIDFSRKLVFNPSESVPTGYTLNNTNSVLTQIDKNTREMFNKITVYGDRQIIRDQETFTAVGGSVFTLLAKPHDTYVTDDGVKKLGGVFELVNFLHTGTQYLVDYDQKNIIFISGTSVGDNVPGSPSTIIVQYGKSIPIVKEATDEYSVATYGLKENIITNLEIKDPNHARDIAVAELSRSSEPAIQANIELSTADISGIQPGQTIVTHFPFEGLSGTTMKVFQTTYDLTQENLLGNKVITVTAGNRIKDVSDELRSMILKIRALQAKDTDISDIITRIKSTIGSMYPDYNWYVRTRTGMGSSFILGDPVLGILGTTTPQPYLGDSRAALAVVESGGTWTL